MPAKTYKKSSELNEDGTINVGHFRALRMTRIPKKKEEMKEKLKAYIIKGLSSTCEFQFNFKVGEDTTAQVAFNEAFDEVVKPLEKQSIQIKKESICANKEEYDIQITDNGNPDEKKALEEQDDEPPTIKLDDDE